MSVETKALVSVEEYLHTSYSPDSDYVDGEIVERNVGEFDHANLELRIGSYLLVNYEKLGYVVVVEQRVQVAPTRFRVPDVCLMLGPGPMEQIFRTPPFIVIEILSPEDKASVLQKKINDYLSFGVAYVWVIDPRERTAIVHTAAGSYQSRDLILRTENPEIVLPLPEIFAALQ
jgi:Uma2 family endonuclease